MASHALAGMAGEVHSRVTAKALLRAALHGGGRGRAAPLPSFRTGDG